MITKEDLKNEIEQLDDSYLIWSFVYYNTTTSEK